MEKRRYLSSRFSIKFPVPFMGSQASENRQFRNSDRTIKIAPCLDSALHSSGDAGDLRISVGNWVQALALRPARADDAQDS